MLISTATDEKHQVLSIAKQYRIASLKKTGTNYHLMQVKSIAEYSVSKRHEIGFHDQLSLNAGQKFCRMLNEHSAILSTFCH